MKKHLLLAFILLAPLLAFCQPTQGLLWKVTSPDGEKSSYLFGSIHLSDPHFTSWSKGVLQSYNECEVVVGEMNLMDLGEQMNMFKNLMMKDSTLKQLLSQAEYDTVMSVLKQHMPKEMLMISNKAKPFFLATQLQSGEGDMSNVVDYYIQKKAKSDGKKTAGLETFQEQLDVIDLIPYKEQAHMLWESCTKIDSLQKEIEKIRTLYLTQNIGEMANMENATNDQYSDRFIKGVLYDRNVVMAERLLDMMKTQKCFFVIGAAHLGGKAGVLQLLLDKGYKLRQVPFAFDKGK